MMKRTSIAIGTILAILVSLLALLGWLRVDQVRHPNDLASFSQVLATKIRSGDSLDDVEAALGPGRSLTAAERGVAATALLRWQKDQPEYYAGGVEDRDLFMRWSIPDGCTLQLQFRGGRLINHAPESYLETTSK